MTNKPVRLAKKTESKADEMILTLYHSVMSRVEAFVLQHALLFLTIAICLMIALFTVVIFVMVGVSATESGMQYNHFADVI